MKKSIFLLGALLTGAMPLMAAQTLNWASPVFSQIVDSQGEALDASFTFELGVFTPGFTPEETNLADWASNWLALDQADYNPSIGYFTASLFLPDVPQYAELFAEKQAYLWVRNGTTIGGGTEWFLASASNWTLPEAFTGCCGNDIPLEWSVTDLGTTTPDYGTQNGEEGPGEIVQSGVFSLQTATVIPEPGPIALIAMATLVLQGRRRRLV